MKELQWKSESKKERKEIRLFVCLEGGDCLSLRTNFVLVCFVCVAYFLKLIPGENKSEALDVCWPSLCIPFIVIIWN